MQRARDYEARRRVMPELQPEGSTCWPAGHRRGLVEEAADAWVPVGPDRWRAVRLGRHSANRAI